MLGSIPLLGFITIYCLFGLGIVLLLHAIKCIKHPFTASENSRFAKAKQLILRRRSLFDKDQGTVYAHKHDPWVADAKAFQKEEL